MKFEKPDAASLESEGDIEHKFLYRLLVAETPYGLSIDPVSIRTQKNLRKFVIGKGSDQKSYFPDYLVAIGSLPVLIADGKKPGSDVLAAFREARLYASELNALHPKGLNPASRIIASDGLRLLAGWHDQATPVLDIPLDAIDPYSPQMAELISLFGGQALERHYTSLLPSIRPSRYW